ncbi:MAG: hypothetical protein ACREX3_18285 [Gammaproteobacteria bacterium]
MHCDECDVEIPAARRQVIPGVRCCVRTRGNGD